MAALAPPLGPRCHRRRRADLARTVADQIRAAILAGAYGTGPMPTEVDLMRDFGVSRNVVREALDLLRDDGLVERRQGAGTFVLTTKARHGCDRLQTVAESTSAAGSLRFHVLDAGLVAASPLVAERLGVARGDEVVFIERLMYFERRPFSLRASWLPADLATPLLGGDLAHGHIYELIEGTLGLRIGRGAMALEATNASGVVAERLGVPAGSALLYIERCTLLEDGRPIEFGFTRNRADRVALVLELDRRGAAAGGGRP